MVKKALGKLKNLQPLGVLPQTCSFSSASTSRLAFFFSPPEMAPTKCRGNYISVDPFKKRTSIAQADTPPKTKMAIENHHF